MHENPWGARVFWVSRTLGPNFPPSDVPRYEFTGYSVPRRADKLSHSERQGYLAISGGKRAISWMPYFAGFLRCF
jgi:hypothetical protein